MYRRAAKYLSRLIVAAFVVVCVVATMRYAHTQARTWVSYLQFRHDLSELAAAKPSGTTTHVVFNAPYRRATFSILVPVDTGYLTAAERVDGTALFGVNRAVRSRRCARSVRCATARPLRLRVGWSTAHAP